MGVPALGISKIKHLDRRALPNMGIPKDFGFISIQVFRQRRAGWLWGDRRLFSTFYAKPNPFHEVRELADIAGPGM